MHAWFEFSKSGNSCKKHLNWDDFFLHIILSSLTLLYLPESFRNHITFRCEPECGGEKIHDQRLLVFFCFFCFEPSVLLQRKLSRLKKLILINNYCTEHSLHTNHSVAGVLLECGHLCCSNSVCIAFRDWKSFKSLFGKGIFFLPLLFIFDREFNSHESVLCSIE